MRARRVKEEDTTEKLAVVVVVEEAEVVVGEAEARWEEDKCYTHIMARPNKAARHIYFTRSCLPEVKSSSRRTGRNC